MFQKFIQKFSCGCLYILQCSATQLTAEIEAIQIPGQEQHLHFLLQGNILFTPRRRNLYFSLRIPFMCQDENGVLLCFIEKGATSFGVTSSASLNIVFFCEIVVMGLRIFSIRINGQFSLMYRQILYTIHILEALKNLSCHQQITDQIS